MGRESFEWRGTRASGTEQARGEQCPDAGLGPDVRALACLILFGKISISHIVSVIAACRSIFQHKHGVSVQEQFSAHTNAEEVSQTVTRIAARRRGDERTNGLDAKILWLGCQNLAIRSDTLKF